MPDNRKNTGRIIFTSFSVLLVAVILVWSFREIDRQKFPDLHHANGISLPASSPSCEIYIDDNGQDMLSVSDYAQLKAVAEERMKNDEWIAIVAPNKLRGLYAKIILHSYGIKNESIRVIPKRLGNPEPAELSEAVVDKLPVPTKSDTAIVVLGNQPLDVSTPTIDMIKRTLAAVECYKKTPPLVVFSGADTAGGISEAKMMALIAESRGVPADGYILEDKSYSTHENVINTVKLLRQRRIDNIILVSKTSQLDVAAPLFQKEMDSVTRLEVDVTDAEIISQMRAYLKV